MTQSRYEYWCQLRVPARSWFRGRGAAEAKRARKAAKRRRDANLTALGMEVSRLALARSGEDVLFVFRAALLRRMSETPWQRWLRVMRSTREAGAESRRLGRQHFREAIRQGEVVP